MVNMQRACPVVANGQLSKMVIIGGGMSGTKFAMAMAKHQRYHITVLNDESELGYNRIMLSPLLSGEKKFDEIRLHSAQAYVEQGVDVRCNCAAVRVDVATQQVYTNTGECLSYDCLIFATGSQPVAIPLENSTAPGVLYFRSKRDVDAMIAYTQQKKDLRCAIIGAGLLGLEAAHGLAALGAQVTVVQRGSYILNQQLDTVSAAMLQRHFEQQGISFVLNAESQRVQLNAQGEVCALELSADKVLEVDLIVMATGVQPNQQLAREAGLVCDRGILVDAQMRSSAACVYAIGECVQFQGNTFGLVAPVYQQAQVLEKHLLGADEDFVLQATATRLKVSGIDLFSVGQITDDANVQYISYLDAERQVYKRLSLHANRLVGAVLYGDVIDGNWFFELIKNATDISAWRHQLLFGQHYCCKLRAPSLH